MRNYAQRIRPFVQDARRSHPSRDFPAPRKQRRAQRPRADRICRSLAARGVEASGGAQARRPRARPTRGTGDALQRRSQGPYAADRLDGTLRRLLARPLRSSRNPAQQDGPMNMTETATRAVVVERKFAHPPEKVWRALTQGALIEEW